MKACNCASMDVCRLEAGLGLSPGITCGRRCTAPPGSPEPMPPPVPNSKAPADCTHTGFHARVDVNRFEDTGLYLAEVRVTCVECGSPFRFRGVPAGLAWDAPTGSIDGLVLNAPIEPEAEKQLQARATFQVPTFPVRH